MTASPGYRQPNYCATCLHLEGVHDRTGCEACRVIAPGLDPEHQFDSAQPRGFALLRHVDQTGVSGTGLVMQGVVFRDGRVAARWVTRDAPRSTVLWDTYEDWWLVHVAPHGGATVLFSDGERRDYDEPSRSVNPVCICDDGSPVWCPVHGDLRWGCATCGSRDNDRVRAMECCASPSIGIVEREY